MILRSIVTVTCVYLCGCQIVILRIQYWPYNGVGLFTTIDIICLGRVDAGNERWCSFGWFDSGQMRTLWMKYQSDYTTMKNLQYCTSYCCSSVIDYNRLAWSFISVLFVREHWRSLREFDAKIYWHLCTNKKGRSMISQSKVGFLQHSIGWRHDEPEQGQCSLAYVYLNEMVENWHAKWKCSECIINTCLRLYIFPLRKANIKVDYLRLLAFLS